MQFVSFKSMMRCCGCDRSVKSSRCGACASTLHADKSTAILNGVQRNKVGRVRISFTPPLWTKPPNNNVNTVNSSSSSSNSSDHQKNTTGDASLPPISAASGNDGFVQTLDVAGGKVTIVTANGYDLQVYVDANAPVVRVSGTHAKGFAAKASLELYKLDANWIRNETRPYAALSTIGPYNAYVSATTVFLANSKILPGSSSRSSAR